MKGALVVDLRLGAGDGKVASLTGLVVLSVVVVVVVARVSTLGVGERFGLGDAHVGHRGQGPLVGHGVETHSGHDGTGGQVTAGGQVAGAGHVTRGIVGQAGQVVGAGQGGRVGVVGQVGHEHPGQVGH